MKNDPLKNKKINPLKRHDSRLNEGELTGGDACRQATFQQCSFERMKNGEKKFSEKFLTGIFFASSSACREIEFFVLLPSCCL
jgi:hypothetical protein